MVPARRNRLAPRAVCTARSGRLISPCRATGRDVCAAASSTSATAPKSTSIPPRTSPTITSPIGRTTEMGGCAVAKTGAVSASCGAIAPRALAACVTTAAGARSDPVHYAWPVETWSCSSRWRVRDRHPRVCAARIFDVGRHHPHDREPLLVDREPSPNDVNGASVSPLP